MSDHALWLVQSALTDLLAGHLPPDQVRTVIQDRNLESEPFDDSELPAVVVRTTGADSYPSNYQSQQEHSADFFINIVTGEESGLAVSRRASQIAALIHSVIWDNRTLDGKTQPIETQGLGVVQQQGPDIGAVSLPLIVKFTTPRGDYTTLLTN